MATGARAGSPPPGCLRVHHASRYVVDIRRVSQPYGRKASHKHLSIRTTHRNLSLLSTSLSFKSTLQSLNQHTTTITTSKMQFSIVSVLAAFAAVASASYNGTSVYPSGTGVSSTGPVPTATSTTAPFDGAAGSNIPGSALAMVIAGGVAMVSLWSNPVKYALETNIL
jgi:hypothetical protein